MVDFNEVLKGIKKLLWAKSITVIIDILSYFYLKRNSRE